LASKVTRRRIDIAITALQTDALREKPIDLASERTETQTSAAAAGRLRTQSSARERRRVWRLSAKQREAISDSDVTYLICVGIALIATYGIAVLAAKWAIGPVE